MRQFSIPSKIFLGLLALTFLIWLLRGIKILGFIPGIVLWILLLLTIGFGVVTSLQRMR